MCFDVFTSDEYIGHDSYVLLTFLSVFDSCGDLLAFQFCPPPSMALSQIAQLRFLPFRLLSTEGVVVSSEQSEK